MEHDNFNNFVIKFPKELLGKGINISWGKGNEIVAHSCDFESYQTKGSKKTSSVPMYHINWDVSLHSVIGRKLVNESHQLFRVLQEVPPERTESIDRNPILVKFSRKYRSILEACLISAKEMLEEKSSSQSELEAQMKIIKITELIWSLCEMIFIEKLTPGSVVQHLLKWCSMHFTEVDDKIQSVTNDIGNSEAHQHPEYWNAFLCLLLQGRMVDAQQLLSIHPNYQTKDYDAFSSLDELIRKMPKFAANQGQSIAEFEMKWKHWQDECKRRLLDGDFDMHDDLRNACRILCGDEAVFDELKDLVGTWYHLLISMLFYTQPMVSLTEIQHYSKYTIDYFGGEECLAPLDRILLAAFELDIYQVIKECSQHLSNWWLSAHLTDLLYHCGLITKRNLDYGENLRESLLIEYASSLIYHSSMWQVVIEYLYACGDHGIEYLYLFIERIPLTSEKKASKVLRACEKLGLVDLAQNVCRQMAVKSLKQNQLGCALTWSLKSNDSSFTVYVSNKLLNEYSKTGQFAHLDLLDYLGSSIMTSERLTFLGKYREFHRILGTNEQKEAADLLLNLVASKMAPMDFWPLLFDNALPFLESEEIVYNSQETAKFMSLLNSLEQNKETLFSKLTDVARETTDKKIELFRIALVRNLSRTMVNFS